MTPTYCSIHVRGERQWPRGSPRRATLRRKGDASMFPRRWSRGAHPTTACTFCAFRLLVRVVRGHPRATLARLCTRVALLQTLAFRLHGFLEFLPRGPAFFRAFVRVPNH